MKPKNKEKKLDQRRGDYQKMIDGRNHASKVQARIDSGGYRKPGSRNK